MSAPSGFSYCHPSLQAYLLGTLDLHSLLALQRRLVYDVGGDRNLASLIMADLKPCITIGREGSRQHVRLSHSVLESRGWHLNWVSRGGAVMLHVPGQVLCYPILSLDEHRLRPADFIQALSGILNELLSSFGLHAKQEQFGTNLLVRGRPIAHLSVAIRDDITSFGMVVNVCPDLELFRDVECNGTALTMTSLQRELTTPIRVPTVRQRLMELLCKTFSFQRISVFHQHPSIINRNQHHAIAARNR